MAQLRVVVIALAFANLLALAVWKGWLGGGSYPGEPERLSNQLNPERMRLVAEAPLAVPTPAPAEAPPAEPPAVPERPAPPGCVAFSGLTTPQRDELGARIASAGPGFKLTESRTGAVTSWWVHVPPQGSKEAAERQVAAANAQVGAAQAAFFPALTLSASAGVRGSELGNLFQASNNLWALGSAVAVSLFDGGARDAAKASARAGHDQTVATYKQTVLVALQEVEDNLAAAGQLGQSVQAQRQALAAAQQALDVLQNQYKAGTVGYLNVLAAQNTVLSAERSLLDARNRQLTAVNQLLKNIAGRWG